MDKIRHRLATALVCLVTFLALAATFLPRASEVLNQFLPALMLTLGYYFGRKS
jgi:hypothetical protein